MTKLIALLVLYTGTAFAAPNAGDLLIKLKDASAVNGFTTMASDGGAKVESLGVDNWVRVQLAPSQLQAFDLNTLQTHPDVLWAQPNYKLRLLNDYQLRDPAKRQALLELIRSGSSPFPTPGKPMKDNPDIPGVTSPGRGADPLFDQQWGMKDIGAKNGWQKARGAPMVVAVIDTGIDYTHEDLVDNLWRNPGETGRDSQGRDKSNNGIDDDGNGYVDDVIGWDFVTNDNKPFDLAVDPMQLLMGGGNPGHGTHCAGNVAARGDNGKGVAGVAPEAKIMGLRFLSEKGQGTTADAIKAINYAVKNGAKVLSNSWGSEGEDPQDPNNEALKDAIRAAEKAGTLFVAAAGNGHQGVGYDNDTDKAPAYPASYDMDTIVSVAALDSSDQLGSFSNWGRRTVDIGAPGVKVFSTTVGGTYSDTVIKLEMLDINVTWDGTSMATPHVAGAAALYWSMHPEKDWRDVKDALMKSAKPISSVSGKTTSNGKLNVDALMMR